MLEATLFLVIKDNSDFLTSLAENEVLFLF